jgi:hypothetical protein
VCRSDWPGSCRRSPSTSFASRYWEQRPLVVHRSDSEYYAPLITLAQFDQLLSTQSDITKALRVIQRGKEDHLYRWSPIGSVPTLEQCYARYRQGATLSLTTSTTGGRRWVSCASNWRNC